MASEFFQKEIIEQKLRVKGYDITLPEIDGGTFGTIHYAYKGNEKYIAKRIRTNSVEKEWILRYRQEPQLMEKLVGHPNIVGYVEHFEELDAIYIIMENCTEGNLSVFFNDHIEEERILDPLSPFKLDIMIQICEGLEKLHTEKIVHRDIKPDNILLRQDGDRLTAKIADLGLSKETSKEYQNKSGDTHFMSTFCGSKHFMAPEMFAQFVKYDETVDIYALGLLFKTMYEFSDHKDMKPRVKGVPQNMTVGMVMNSAEYPALDVMPHDDNDDDLKQHFKHLIFLMTNVVPGERQNIVFTKQNIEFLKGQENIATDYRTAKTKDVEATFIPMEWRKSRQLVSISSDKDGYEKIEIHQETLKLLENVSGPVSVIAVVGRFRSGKSYFLNKMAKNDTLFETSRKTYSCTKGIWVWVTHDKTSARNVILLDTEGLSDPKTNQQIGSKLFSIASFLTSNIVLFIKDYVDSSHTTPLSEAVLFMNKAVPDFKHPMITMVVRNFDQDLDGQTENDYFEEALNGKEEILKTFSEKKCYICEDNEVEQAAEKVFLESGTLSANQQITCGTTFMKELKWYANNLNAFNGKSFLTWNGVKSDFCKKLSEDVTALSKDRKPNNAPWKTEEVISYFKSKKIMKQLLIKFKQDMSDIDESVTKQLLADILNSEEFSHIVTTHLDKEWKTFIDHQLKRIRYYCKGFQAESHSCSDEDMHSCKTHELCAYHLKKMQFKRAERFPRSATKQYQTFEEEIKYIYECTSLPYDRTFQTKLRMARFVPFVLTFTAAVTSGTTVGIGTCLTVGAAAGLSVGMGAGMGAFFGIVYGSLYEQRTTKQKEFEKSIKRERIRQGEIACKSSQPKVLFSNSE